MFCFFCILLLFRDKTSNVSEIFALDCRSGEKYFWFEQKYEHYYMKKKKESSMCESFHEPHQSCPCPDWMRREFQPNRSVEVLTLLLPSPPKKQKHLIIGQFDDARIGRPAMSIWPGLQNGTEAEGLQLSFSSIHYSPTSQVVHLCIHALHWESLHSSSRRSNLNCHVLHHRSDQTSPCSSPVFHTTQYATKL